ncbi:MAG TPA: hypothetical protein PLC40_05525 [Candidatus Hydrogenedentes bacterium]|nr:hypothetical protein [Candidatus Hydrogenedentota bacterium]
MRDVLLAPVLEDGATRRFIGDARARSERLEAVTKSSIFEGLGKGGPVVQATWSNALRTYCQQRGRMPSDEMLACAHQAIENAIFATAGKGAQNVGGMLLEAANISTTEGIIMRDRMVALILPVMLLSVTGNIVSYIPGTFNQSEIFKVWRVAASTFGDLTSGDKIDHSFSGQYSSMDQRYLTGTGNGTKTGSGTTDFDLNATSKWGAVRPFKKKSIKILHDRNVVAKDDGAAILSGSFTVGETTVTVTGTVNYANGIVHPVFSTAPANGIEIHVAVDIDIEKDPTLIPAINHEMDSRTIYPHESAIEASTTLQSLWALRRELNLNADSMAMLAMRNLLSADKDRKHLADMYFFMKGQKSWNMHLGDNQYFQEHYETVKQTLLEVDAALMTQTGTAGLVGIVADSKSAVVFKSMKEPNFSPVPGYVRIPQPHYIGRLFGMWDVYEDPQRATDYSCLCFAKGRGIGEAGYVAGDAIPAMAFKHAMQSDLKYENTLWELAYRDLNPFDGREYFMELAITDSE